ncbi:MULTISPECIES: hypothetical protein [Photorhabdus]|uniref:hypothetical protein n=1 Tax=Photorhabdus TaxID=29487 RepID=UPI00031AF2EE|nr:MULTISPECIES: hypothetical protein [Photorhabdus]NDK96601.1 hypothetical protein [Photorhabdus laumondii subsp. laumondii]NDL50383.1 hypothetical protein [Photorhabdus laumondii subsp. laumondii]
MTGVSECSQQRGNLKDNGYIRSWRISTVETQPLLLNLGFNIATIDRRCSYQFDNCIVLFR